jgi:ribosomal protein S18 acetylase RimI-like enzyme
VDLAETTGTGRSTAAGHAGDGARPHEGPAVSSGDAVSGALAGGAPGATTDGAPGAILVRDAGNGDEAVVTELVQELARLEGEPAVATPDLVAEYLAFPLSGALLAELEGHVVGLLTWFVRPGLFHGGRWGFIDELIVREEARGRGVADALMSAAMARFAAAGCLEVSVSAMPDNEPAKALYRKHGMIDEALFLERHF